MHLAVPGFAQEELEVEIAGRFVTVHGDQTQTAIEDVPFRLHERLVERFQLPADVDTNGGSKTPRKVPIKHRFGVNPDASGV